MKTERRGERGGRGEEGTYGLNLPQYANPVRAIIVIGIP